MDQITKIKDLITPILETNHFCLYDLKWVQEGKMRILQIAIADEHGKIDMDQCAEISEKISEVMDEADLISHEYYLEVCSPGAERELRNFEEVKNAAGEYIYAKFHHAQNKLVEVKGTLENVEDDILHITYMDKAVKKKMQVSYDNIAFIRLSVKI